MLTQSSFFGGEFNYNFTKYKKKIRILKIFFKKNYPKIGISELKTTKYCWCSR